MEWRVLKGLKVGLGYIKIVIFSNISAVSLTGSRYTREVNALVWLNYALYGWVDVQVMFLTSQKPLISLSSNYTGNFDCLVT